MSKKILIITPKSQHVIGFRKSFIESLLNENYEVSVLAFDNDFEEKFSPLKISFFHINDSNRSIDPLKVLTLKNKIKLLIKKINPDIVFTFQLKPNTFGVLAAHEAGIKNIFSMVEGTGDPYTYNTPKWRIIRMVCTYLYRKAFKYCKKVFFLNKDDKKEFIDLKIVKEPQCETIFGIGVDLEYFSYRPLKNYNHFLMIARMLETKGIYEYCKAAREVKKIYPDAVFNYLGAEGTVKIKDIQEFIDDGSINYLGVTDDVRPYIEDCTFLVLPSYKEGMPVTVMEAQAMGRPCIVSDTNGCRDTVIDGYNGYIVKKKDKTSLIFKFNKSLSNEEIRLFIYNSNYFANKYFDQKKINNYLKKIILNNN